MPPKRKAAEIEASEEVDDRSREEEVSKQKNKKQKSKSNSVPRPAKASSASKKKPSTLKEKILHLLANQEKMVGLASIKKILQEQYEVEDNKANNNRINKTLKDLSEEERDDFGKVGGSYHGGENSPSYQEYATKEAEKEAARQFLEDHKDELQCPYCNTWNNEEGSCKGEDSVARGGKYECESCGKKFFTWISDYSTNRVGHRVEYRYGPGKGEY